jgi:predicted phage baseplate assembly protein
VASGAINKLPSITNIKVNNDLPARGGADTETVADALDRIPGALRRRDRAVTAGDFEELALATPGAAVGRADCLPRFYPPTFQSEKAGVVSVVVWPASDPAHPNAPVPDRDLLREVCAWLDQRRLVTTELYVIPPTYVRVAVAVGLQVKPGFGVEAVRRWVELVIRQYLAPLPPFGPDGAGWPLGRRVFGPELQAAALQVEGVDFLEGLDVARWDGTTWITGPVDLNPWEVPELAEITVVNGPQLKPGDVIGPVPPPKTPVPIPIIREVC